MTTPNVPYSRAGSSPPRPVPAKGDQVRLVQRSVDGPPIPARIGEIGYVELVQERMYTVRWPRGSARVTPLQIELVAK